MCSNTLAATCAALLCLFLIPNTLANAADAELCGSKIYNAQVEVEEVIDGDTVRLTDGRRLRFAGINTPELGIPEQGPEPFADEAKRAIEKLLAENHKLLLRYDEDKRDRYNRVLAHVFLPDNTNIQAWLITQGLATFVVEPPNLWQSDCYERLENTARKNKLGIWSTPRFQFNKADDIKPGDTGFYLIQGRVKHITNDQKAIWLHFNELLAIRIDNKDLWRFKHFQPEALKSHFISVRGWIYPYGETLAMRVKHPRAMIVQD